MRVKISTGRGGRTRKRRKQGKGCRWTSNCPYRNPAKYASEAGFICLAKGSVLAEDGMAPDETEDLWRGFLSTFICVPVMALHTQLTSEEELRDLRKDVKKFLEPLASTTQSMLSTRGWCSSCTHPSPCTTCLSSPSSERTKHYTPDAKLRYGENMQADQAINLPLYPNRVLQTATKREGSV
jgi:hypothetical protein